ncbi:hypothetical protein L2E82_21399 [Cichorium intybus]|uniref:Uncharacterized protein n=1 Tax=Cichorium intybus TaxID=13427 RepID=A0ACB9DVA6_CICIN|nr:hypothetical protein L2E82_21399 [Cichorium intybus]
MGHHHCEDQEIERGNRERLSNQKTFEGLSLLRTYDFMLGNYKLLGLLITEDDVAACEIFNCNNIKVQWQITQVKINEQSSSCRHKKLEGEGIAEDVRPRANPYRSAAQ